MNVSSLTLPPIGLEVEDRSRATTKPAEPGATALAAAAKSSRPEILLPLSSVMSICPDPSLSFSLAWLERDVAAAGWVRGRE